MGGWGGQAGGSASQVSEHSLSHCIWGSGGRARVRRFPSRFFVGLRLSTCSGWARWPGDRTIAQTRPSLGARAALASIMVEVVVCGVGPGLQAPAAADPKLDRVGICPGLVICLRGGGGKDVALDLHQ